MNVLVAAPTSDRKDYCLEIYARQVNEFTYPHYDTYLVDNSEDCFHTDTLYDLGFDTEWIKPEGSPAEYICKSQNAIRDRVLYNDYEWLFMLETDVFVPLNILDYLTKCGNKVHTFAYFMGNEVSTLCVQEREYNLEEPYSEHKMGMDFDVYAVSVGCTFIHRSILEQIEFRTEKDIFSDPFFFDDVKQSGIKPTIDTNIIPAHYRSNMCLTDLKVYQ